MESYRYLMLAGLVTASLGCGRSKSGGGDELMPHWRHDIAVKDNVVLRDVVNGTGDIAYFEGWYAIEFDPKNGGAWRWMGRRGTIRLRSRPGMKPAQDMDLQVFGWTPDQKFLGTRTSHLEFMVNGHVLGRLEPEANKPFQHNLVVPKWLLENSRWVDLTITVANTARPPNDWRDIGFATTGVIWKPVGT